ncbi:MAG: glycosyltransferase family 9 protein [Microbacter sp.]
MQIVITRFSALGDIAISVPLIRQLAERNPTHHFIMVSMPLTAPLFREISNLTYIAFDKKGRHKGWIGLLKLYFELRKLHPDALVDLHDVLRTKWLRWMFAFNRTKISIIDKGRAEKNALIKHGFQHSKQLLPTIERYANAFESIGLTLKPRDWSSFSFSLHSKPIEKELNTMFDEKIGNWIGIAPFAQHRGKQLPFETIEKVLEHFSKEEHTTIFLFGAGKEEGTQLEKWAQRYPNNINLANRFEIDEEIMLMKRLNVMLTMDSANMHLASIAGIPVVSVWGATHPFAGFYGYNQPEELAIQIDLFCRPCSVYGQKSCRFGTWDCLNNIKPDIIIDKITSILTGKHGRQFSVEIK